MRFPAAPSLFFEFRCTFEPTRPFTPEAVRNISSVGFRTFPLRETVDGKRVTDNCPFEASKNAFFWNTAFLKASEAAFPMIAVF